MSEPPKKPPVNVPFKNEGMGVLMRRKLPTLEDILGSEEFTAEQATELPATAAVGFTHAPIVFLVDTSARAADGESLRRIDDAVRGFLEKVSRAQDEFFRKLQRQGDFAVMRYGGSVELSMAWTPGGSLSRLPDLVAGGAAPMGEAILRTSDMLLDRLRGYKAMRSRAFCATVLHLTCGRPDDMDPAGEPAQRELWRRAMERIRLLETMGTVKNPYAQFFHLVADPSRYESFKGVIGDAPMFTPGDDDAAQPVSLLEGTDSVGRCIRFIEIGMNNIMSGG